MLDGSSDNFSNAYSRFSHKIFAWVRLGTKKREGKVRSFSIATVLTFIVFNFI